MFEKELKPHENIKFIHDISRCSTSCGSVKRLFKGIQLIETAKLNANVLRCCGIGLRSGGRTSLYELWYFHQSKTLYSIDMSDRDYVCAVKFLCPAALRGLQHY